MPSCLHTADLISPQDNTKQYCLLSSFQQKKPRQDVPTIAKKKKHTIHSLENVIRKKDAAFYTFLCSRADGAPCWLALGNNGDLDLCSLGGFAWRGTRCLPPLTMGPELISFQALHLITGYWHCTTQTKKNKTHTLHKTAEVFICM